MHNKHNIHSNLSIKLLSLRLLRIPKNHNINFSNKSSSENVPLCIGNQYKVHLNIMSNKINYLIN